MDHKTIRVSKATHERIERLATASGCTMQAVLDRAIDLLERDDL